MGAVVVVVGEISESLGDFTKLFLQTPGRSDWYLSPGCLSVLMQGWVFRKLAAAHFRIFS